MVLEAVDSFLFPKRPEIPMPAILLRYDQLLKYLMCPGTIAGFQRCTSCTTVIATLSHRPTVGDGRRQLPEHDLQPLRGLFFRLSRAETGGRK
jgi:hypothetical protein